MTLDLYTASMAHRYSDPCAAVIGTSAEAVTEAIEEMMAYEDAELASYCEHEGPREDDENGVSRCTDECNVCLGECSMCHADLVWYGAHRVGHVSDFARSLSDAKEIIRELRESNTGTYWLETN